MFRRRMPVVGLDIGSSGLKVVEVKRVGRTCEVVAFGTMSLGFDAIVDGAILDRARVADAVRQLLETSRITRREIATSLSGRGVIVKRVTLPAMPRKELAEAAYWEAVQEMPFDIREVHLDHQIVSAPTNGRDSTTTMDVLLVAAKKDTIVDYTAVLGQAGRIPTIVDLDAFALQNAFEANYDADPSAVIALLNVGASTTNINMMKGGQSILTRDVPIGGNTYTETLRSELNLSREHAERLKCYGSDEGIDCRVQAIVQAVSEQVRVEIQKTFDFFKSTALVNRIDRLMLSGGSSRTPGFAELLASRFELSVEPLDPFRNVRFDPAKFGLASAADVAPVSAVAVGLALRRAGDA